MRDLDQQHGPERPPAEGTLRAAQDSFFRLAELSSDAVLVVLNDRVEFINAGGLRLLNMASANQVQGHCLYDLFQPASRELIRSRIESVVEAGMLTTPLKEQVVAADGAVIDVELFAAAFRTHRGDAVQMVLHDVTEQTVRHASLGKEDEVT